MNTKSNAGRVIKIPARGPIVEVPDAHLNWPRMNQELFGSSTMLIERVRPYGLARFNATLADSEVVIVVDEEGIIKRQAFNARASFIYGWQFHGQPIMGDAYLVGEGIVMDEDGPDFVFHGLPDTFTMEALNGIILSASIAANERELQGK